MRLIRTKRNTAKVYMSRMRISDNHRLGTSESTVKQHYHKLRATYVDADGFLAKCKIDQN